MAVLGLLLVCLGAKAQVKNQDMKELFLLLETDVSVEESRRRLLSNGFVSRGLIGSKQENFFGMIDSTSVILTLRKTNKKGKVWGYELLWNNAETNWLNKRIYIDQLAKSLNVINKQNPSFLLKTLPQYCSGKEADCFADGVAKYQYNWYWNSEFARIKEMELKVTPSFQVEITIINSLMLEKLK
jgi:hypothetical protein